MNASDFLRGQTDCKNGVEHRAGQSESYDRGYAAQYGREQLLSEMGFKQNELICS